MADKRFKIIYLEITNACNFTCDYCPIDQQTRKKIVMDSQFARNVIDQIADNNLTEFLTFHLMGEPFLHKDLCGLTGYAEARGMKVRLLTNGSLLEKKRNEGLFENNLSRLEIGFRTPNDTSFDLRLRGGHLTLDEYIRRVKELIDDHIRLRAKTEICIKLFIRSHVASVKLGDPYEHLTSEEDNLRIGRMFQDHSLETARKYGVPTEEWEHVPLRIVNGEYPIFPGINIGFSRIQDFWVREQRGNNHGTGYRGFMGGCSAGFRDDFGILASGEVTTCCVDYDGKNVIGDLHKHSLMEILESAEAKHILRSFKWFIPPTEFCRECRGGPTLLSSIAKQASTIAIDVRDRIAPRKKYRSMRKRLATINDDASAVLVKE
jgi:MoaA/NifB/PqqE/SkfB family radical SAM enzyme